MQFLHRYTVEVIAEYKDLQEPNIIMHWAVGKKSPGEWTKPEDCWIPKNSIKFKDNIAV